MVSRCRTMKTAIGVIAVASIALGCASTWRVPPSLTATEVIATAPERVRITTAEEGQQVLWAPAIRSDTLHGLLHARRWVDGTWQVDSLRYHIPMRSVSLVEVGGRSAGPAAHAATVAVAGAAVGMIILGTTFCLWEC